MNGMEVYVNLLLFLTVCQSLPLKGGSGGQSEAGASDSRWTGPQMGAGRGANTDPPSRDTNNQDEDGGLPLPTLTRLSFGDLQHSSSSNSYSPSCCHIVPELCTSEGRCSLNVTDCVSFCICAQSPDLPWCSGELRRLHNVLQDQRDKAQHEAGAVDGNDGAGLRDGTGSDVESDARSGSSQNTGNHGQDSSPGFGMTMGSMSLSETSIHGRPGVELGSLNLGGEDSNPPEDNVMSPAQLASSLSGDVTPQGFSDLLSNNGVKSNNPNGPEADQPAPPLSPMMNGGTGTTNTIKPSFHDGQRTNSSASSANATEIISTNSSNDDNNTYPHPALNNLHQPDKADSIMNNLHNLTADGQEILPWWPNDDNSCGTECMLNGGRCVFDFNRTYTQVCIYDSVQPCHKLNCLHGTCVAQNGSYSCQCEDGWAGIFCNKRCHLDCGPHGHCVVMAGDVACKCEHNYTGIHCDDLKPTPAPWTGAVLHDDVVTVWQIAAGCLGVAAGLLVILLLLGYVTWRKQWLPMRKLVHYFQHYEEDDGKEYDAFVSYRSGSRDEMFVVHELYPHLERHLDFKLCMHFRDFTPGETIADNIIQAIENSRRTILILSPAYVQSEWCRLEYQKAQHEMLKLRHKIIPIMIEDVSHVQPIDRNLRTILDTVTYIKWPGTEDSKRVDKFWKLLQLSMPKKKSDYTRSLSSTESCSSDRPLTAVSSSCFSNVVNSMSSASHLHPQRSLSITSSIEEAAADEEEKKKEHEEIKPGQNRIAHHAKVMKNDLQGSEIKHDNLGSHDWEKNSDDDNACLRDRTSSVLSEGNSPPPDPGEEETCLDFPNRDEPTHVTSDDHIVEIREICKDRVRVTPWVPARLSSKC